MGTFRTARRPSTTTWSSGAAGTALAMAAGAALQYLLDPQQGRPRRARLAAQLQGRLRSAAQEATGPARSKGQLARDKLGGRLQQARQPSTGPESDRALVDKVRSEVLGQDPYRDATINVMAVDGTVTLRGQLQRPEQIRALREQVARVTGVRRVDSYLHLPGTPPPNTAEVAEASVHALREAAGDAVQHTPD